MNLTKMNFYIKDNSHKSLLARGFQFRKSIVNDEPDIYTYRFALYKFKNKLNTLTCTIIVNAESGKVSLLVNQQDGSTYAPFYNENHYGNFTEMLDSINKKTLKEFEKFDIEEQE